MDSNNPYENPPATEADYADEDDIFEEVNLDGLFDDLEAQQRGEYVDESHYHLFDREDCF